MRIEGEVRGGLTWECVKGNVVSLKNSYTVGNNKHGERYIIKSQKMREWERTFDNQISIYRDKYIKGPCKLHVVVYLASANADLDNAVTSLCDALQRNHAFVNDNQVTLLDARKVVDPANPRVLFAIEPLQSSLFG